MFIFVGVVGPLLTFTMLWIVIYRPQAAREGRVRGRPRLAAIGAGGEPVFPAGVPYCRRDAIVYASGTTRCETGNEPLA